MLEKIEAKVLGQLSLMQTVLINLPTIDSILSFVCEGLKNIPGVNSVVINTQKSDINSTTVYEYFLKRNSDDQKVIYIDLDDVDAYLPYEQYVRNFVFMVEIMLDERRQRDVIEEHKRELEHRVEERTQLLENEIEERKQIEISLQQSEELFRTSFDYSSVGMCLVDISGRFIKVNSRLCNIWGYTEEELVSKNFVDITFPDDLQIGIDLVKRMLSKQQDNADFEKRYVCKDGRVMLARISTALVRDNMGEALFFITHVQDITEERYNQEKLVEREKQLKEQNEEYLSVNEELNERNRELIDAKEHAEESDRLKSAFLANMSHEIRTPMNGIVGFADLINNEDISNEKRKYFSDIISKSALQLLNIVNDIVDISKIEAGQIEITKSEVCLNTMLLDLYAFYKTSSERNNVNLYLSKKMDDRASTIYTDEQKVKQILNNFLSNALKFTHAGYIELGYKKKDGNIILYVKDTGVGIPVEQQDKIFDRFHQVRHNNGKTYGGTGLGLAIAKAFIEKLDGEIILNSKEGEGSEFAMSIPYIPVYDDLATDSETPDSLPRILVVEDEEINYLYLEEIINSLGFHIVHAKSGRDTMQIVKEQAPFDLVLMDIKLPDANGLDLTKKILEDTPDAKIVAQTAYAMQGDRDKALEAGCVDYVAKPIIKEKIVELINKYIMS